MIPGLAPSASAAAVCRESFPVLAAVILREAIVLHNRLHNCTYASYRLCGDGWWSSLTHLDFQSFENFHTFGALQVVGNVLKNVYSQAT